MLVCNVQTFSDRLRQGKNNGMNVRSPKHCVHAKRSTPARYDWRIDEQKSTGLTCVQLSARHLNFSVTHCMAMAKSRTGYPVPAHV